MATITEDYVSFEIAKLLKEKGFNECFCSKSYYANKQVDVKHNIDNHFEEICLAPTLQMAMKWLREIHNIFVEISISIDLNGKYHYSYFVLDKECKYVRKGYTDFDWDYEQAAEAAIKYCLENLI